MNFLSRLEKVKMSNLAFCLQLKGTIQALMIEIFIQFAKI